MQTIVNFDNTFYDKNSLSKVLHKDLVEFCLMNNPIYKLRKVFYIKNLLQFYYLYHKNVHKIFEFIFNKF
jgi:hypothetical protein